MYECTKVKQSMNQQCNSCINVSSNIYCMSVPNIVYMLNWPKMTNPQTQREIKRIEIDTREEGRRWRGRTITSTPPVPTPQSCSVPPITAQTSLTIKHRRLNQRDSTQLSRIYIEQNPGSLEASIP